MVWLIISSCTIDIWKYHELPNNKLKRKPTQLQCILIFFGSTIKTLEMERTFLSFYLPAVMVKYDSKTVYMLCKRIILPLIL